MTFIRDPLAKIFTVGCISLGTLGNTPLRYVAVAAGVYSCWTLASRPPPSALLARLKGALLFLALIVAVNGMTGSGRVIFGAGGLYLTEEGLARGLEQALRLSIVIWGALLLVSSGRIEELQDAAERLTTRRGFPLVAAGTITVAYLPLMIESARRVTIARRARGEDDHPPFPTGLAHAAAAALPLFASAMRNADALAEAMESRCYSPSSPRTRFLQAPVAARDAAIALAVAVFTAATLTGIA